jgi:hypothetical protein
MPAAGGPTDDPDNAANRLGSPSALPTPGEDEQRIEADPQRQYPSTDDPPLDLDAIAAETSGAEATGDAPLDDLAAQADRIALANAIATADRQRQQDRLREALATLSLFYNVPGLAEEERAALLGRIDWLAGEVIYSRRHLLEQPYRVSQGESLAAIAAKLQVPAQLLATVNGLQPGDPVVPGSELKVIRGPFRAEVNLERDELTLFLGELYAGRFPIVEGTDPVPQPGSYEVREKRTDRNYYAAGGQVIPADDPRNPYGQYWIDLGSRLSIHATGAQAAGPEQSCIQLRTADARDVFGILSAGSDVSIVR